MGQRGRPPKEEQLETQKTLQWYFERGITATVTSQRTGKNINTVCKYFEEFYEQISEFEKVEFLERQKKERERIIITFDSQILDTYESLDDIESEINKYKQEKKPIPRHLISLKLETMKYISILTEKKGSFVMLPSMDDATKKKIEEWVKENAKAG
ncbi:MAG TPA: hypothetical protein VLD38_05680 [Nitrosopumilaceae archaeon]|nr:hypothetical protein [Nitrosopumilaceae archaeon]